MISGRLYSSFISCQGIKSNLAVMIPFHFSERALSFQEYREGSRGKWISARTFSSAFPFWDIFYYTSPPPKPCRSNYSQLIFWAISAPCTYCSSFILLYLLLLTPLQLPASLPKLWAAWGYRLCYKHFCTLSCCLNIYVAIIY